jgi:hypothetical protein
LLFVLAALLPSPHGELQVGGLLQLSAVLAQEQDLLDLPQGRSNLPQMVCRQCNCVFRGQLVGQEQLVGGLPLLSGRVLVAVSLLQQVLLAQCKLVQEDVLADHGVVLAEDAGVLSNWSQQAAPDLVEEVVVGGVELDLAGIFLVGSFERELQFALDLVAEEQIDEDVVLLLVQPVFNSHDFKHLWPLLTDLNQVLVDAQELSLRAGVLAADEVADLEADQVDLPQYFVVGPQLVLGQLVLVPLEVDFSGRPRHSL